MSGFNIELFLKDTCAKKVSDVHISLGKPPALRMLNNIYIMTKMQPLDDEDFTNILKTIMTPKAYDSLRNLHNFDFTYEIPGVSRFRVNYCLELGKPKLTMRTIPYDVPTLAQLSLPSVLRKFIEYNSGIVLVTGPTGTGKSTTLACLLNIINLEKPKHIITIEDPVEFIYTNEKSIITQRQVGVDVEDFPTGIKYALRQDPDVILVGEIRDKETMEAALSAAETGHLVFSTIHTNSAIQTINRIVNMFDDNTKPFVRDRLANCLRGTIAQKLVHKIEGGRAPAVEIFTVTPAIKDYIAKNELDKIYQLIQQGGVSGMTTMNASIYSLLKSHVVEEEEALKASNDPIELRQMIKGYYQGARQRRENNILDV